MTRIAEGVHQSVWSTLGFFGSAPGRTRGLTGLAYRSVYAVTRWLGDGADTALAGVASLLDTADGDPKDTPRRNAALAALNGVMGDRLAADENPLAIPMTLRYQGEVLDPENLSALSEATGKVVLLVHGLCMDDGVWHPRDGIGHVEALVALGYTPVYLRYNSGLHTSQNGRALAAQLERLVELWPVPVEELSIVAHSMGGLLTRSALYYARRDGLRWPEYVQRVVFLGTPHHGAPLERAGNWVDTLLGSTPYTAPFAALGQLRSAGITDLRYGYVLDEDWQGRDRFHRAPDRRSGLPLPEGVACYTVAATRSPDSATAASRLRSDGLVPLSSALGRHDDDPRRTLAFPEAAQCIAYGTDHLALLSSPVVTRQIVEWLR